MEARIDSERAEVLLGWWRDAGVDVAVQEAAPSWRSLHALASEVRREAEMPAAERPVPTSAERVETPLPAPAPSLPAEDDELVDWLFEQARDAKAVVAGTPFAAGAPLAIVGARPLGPGSGAGSDNEPLLAAMLRAIGHPETPLSFIDPGFLDGLEREPVGKNHLDAMQRLLAARMPERLLLLGDGAARALLGEPLARARGKLHRLHGIRTVATFHPHWLRRRPADKRLAWHDLQLLMGNS